MNIFATRRRKPSSANLMRALAARANSFEQHADAPAAVNPAATRLAPAPGNPSFAAQFDVQFKLKYFSVAAGVYTNVTAAALLAAEPTLATQLPVFLFGNSDYSGGFAKLKAQFPLSGWNYGTSFVYGKDYPWSIYGEFDATVEAHLSNGDLVSVFDSSPGATDYVAIAIIHCTQVGYGTLLDALNSDMFTLNTVRYIMSDTTAVGLAQYNNNINIMKQSLFGKFDSDFVSPNSFKIPEQQQNGIIDIPLIKGIDKQVALATYINYDAVDVQWSLFVRSVNKLDY